MAALGIVLLMWWVLTDGTGIISQIRFPGPSETWAAWQQILWDGYANALWYQHVLRSVSLVTIGFLSPRRWGLCWALPWAPAGRSRRW